MIFKKGSTEIKNFMTPLILKSFPWEFSLNGVHVSIIHVFACKQINMFIERMSEDSIFIYCLFIMYKSFEDQEKPRKFTSNTALMSVSHNDSREIFDIK